MTTFPVLLAKKIEQLNQLTAENMGMSPSQIFYIMKDLQPSIRSSLGLIEGDWDALLKQASNEVPQIDTTVFAARMAVELRVLLAITCKRLFELLSGSSSLEWDHYIKVLSSLYETYCGISLLVESDEDLDNAVVEMMISLKKGF